jgi:hypothetical protein
VGHRFFVRQRRLIIGTACAIGIMPWADGHGAADESSGIMLDALAPRVTIRDMFVNGLPSDSELADGGLPMYAQDDLGLGDDDEAIDVFAVRKKSPRRAFLQSFLIPGWGQWYTGNRWKPFLFLGLEVAGWYGVSHFHANGNDIETEYKAFADEHWDDEKYLFGLYEVYYDNNPSVIDPDDSLDYYMDTITYTFVDEVGGDSVLISQVFSHHAFFKSDGSSVEEDEYYENIGKYHQFNFGWDDYPDIGEPGFPDDWQVDTSEVRYESPNRKAYTQRRADANREFEKASKFLIAVVGNHLVAGIEAALSARRYNRTADHFGSRLEPKMRLVRSPADGNFYPKFIVTYKF